MNLIYRSVETPAEIHALAHMADEIWHEYWPALIGDEQTDYMVDRFQSPEAIERDIRENGYVYHSIEDEQGTLVGYTGGAIERYASPSDEGANTHGEAISRLFLKRFFISKIYLYEEQRGKHYASAIMEFWNDYARKNNLEGMYLTVNKGNDLGIRAYRGRGFDIIESIKADIGDGFVMDDYIMARSVI